MLDKSNPSGAFVDAAATLLTIRDFIIMGSDISKKWTYSASGVTLRISIQIIMTSATGTLRVLNNRHCVSDVFFGAGLGILVDNLTVYFDPRGKDQVDPNIKMSMAGNGLAFEWRF